MNKFIQSLVTSIFMSSPFGLLGVDPIFREIFKTGSLNSIVNNGKGNRAVRNIGRAFFFGRVRVCVSEWDGWGESPTFVRPSFVLYTKGLQWLWTIESCKGNEKSLSPTVCSSKPKIFSLALFAK